jgi:hypothetical protein
MESCHTISIVLGGGGSTASSHYKDILCKCHQGLEVTSAHPFAVLFDDVGYSSVCKSSKLQN